MSTVVCYSNIDHCITKIDDRFYDITGEVEAVGYWVPIADDPAAEARQAACVWEPSQAKLERTK